MNKVILSGRLGDDVKQVNPTGSIYKVSLATSRKYKRKDGEKVEETTWHNLTLFGDIGKNFAQYHSKGDKALVVGRIENKKVEDKYFSGVIVESWEFIKSYSGNNNQSTASTPSKLIDSMPDKYRETATKEIERNGMIPF